MYARNYKNPNKAGWSPAIVQRKIGPRNYTCLLTYENREIKRHIDQLRDGQPDEGGEMDAGTSLSDENVIELTEDEQESETSQSFSSPIATNSTTIDSSDANNATIDSSTDATDVSIADVIERPSVRACASKAKDALTAMFTSNRKH